MPALPAATRVLFQGDSITDAGRSRQDLSHLGVGYPAMVAQAWMQQEGGSAPRFLNRGISGNRIYDLEARWEEDCLALQPDWLSILIGINDTWRRYDSNVPSPIADFEACYRRLLDRARAATTARLLILEPFLLPSNPGLEAWRDDLDPRIHVVRRIARDYGALYVPLDGLFAAAATRRPPAHWAPDGVHPSPEGHAFIADAWLAAVCSA